MILFSSVFNIKENTVLLERTLFADNRWYKVGEMIFSKHDNGKEKLRHIKNKGAMRKCEQFFEIFGIRCPDVTWKQFKDIGIEKYQINSFQNLFSEDHTKKITEMSTAQKEKIAAEMVPDGWKYFIGYYFKDDDIKWITKKIDNHRSSSSSSTVIEDLVDLICQISPDFTMKQFFDVLIELNYMGTLNDLRKMLKDN